MLSISVEVSPIAKDNLFKKKLNISGYKKASKTFDKKDKNKKAPARGKELCGYLHLGHEVHYDAINSGATSVHAQHDAAGPSRDRH